MRSQSIVNGRDRSWPVILPMLYALSVIAYYALRYGYRWAEQDTAQITFGIRRMIDEATIAPSSGAYPHGYGYQSIVVFLSMVTGLSVIQLQYIVLPFMLVIISLASFIAFRSLTGSAKLGALAALLLMVQPEFLFVVQRGSHEKVTHAFILSLVFLLSVSFQRRMDIASQVGYILVFYLVTWALITTTSMFSSSLIAALVLSFVVGLVVLQIRSRSRSERRIISRLIWTICSCYALLFIFVVYIYTPSQHNYYILQTLIERLSALFLTFDTQSNPYATIGSAPGSAWVSPWIYPILTFFNWSILLIAAITWCWLGVRFLRNDVLPDSRHLLLLWLFTGAFALQMVVSVVIDLSGFLSSNLQIRLFPLFMMFAIPLAIVGLHTCISRFTWLPRRPLIAIAAVMLLGFATTSLLKSTNDPLVSNKWLFFSASEEQALIWADQSLDRREMWIEFDERLAVMQITFDLTDPERGNQYLIGPFQDTARYTLVSDVIKNRGLRLKFPLPNIREDDIIYDNGNAQVYHNIPRTPYEP